MHYVYLVRSLSSGEKMSDLPPIEETPATRLAGLLQRLKEAEIDISDTEILETVEITTGYMLEWFNSLGLAEKVDEAKTLLNQNGELLNQNGELLDKLNIDIGKRMAERARARRLNVIYTWIFAAIGVSVALISLRSSITPSFDAIRAWLSLHGVLVNTASAATQEVGQNAASLPAYFWQNITHVIMSLVLFISLFVSLFGPSPSSRKNAKEFFQTSTAYLIGTRF